MRRSRSRCFSRTCPSRRACRGLCMQAAGWFHEALLTGTPLGGCDRFATAGARTGELKYRVTRTAFT